MTGLAGLRRFAQEPPAGASGAATAKDREASAATPGSPAEAREACEFCSAAVAADHGHVADLDNGTLVCACRACYLLFTRAGAGLTRDGGRYRAVGDRYLTDPDGKLTQAEFDALEIPVGLTFFLRSSRTGRVAGFYPSPAGVTQCELDLAAWDRLAASRPLLAAAADDVEAILMTRSGDRVDCFLVPVDACYALAGRMRRDWRGFDGGPAARQAVEAFLSDVRSRARPLRGRP
jgi:hypothetical protein